MGIVRINRVLPYFIIGIAIVLSSCGNKKSNQDSSGVSPDLVTNPISASGKESKSNLPEMTFKNDKHDFGLIVQGEKVSHTFQFTNTGGSDLIISNASATCGCTVPTWSKEPVKPGDSGQIEVVFDSSNRSGINNKEVKILTNAQPNTIKLAVRAEIYVPK